MELASELDPPERLHGHLSRLAYAALSCKLAGHSVQGSFLNDIATNCPFLRKRRLSKQFSAIYGAKCMTSDRANFIHISAEDNNRAKTPESLPLKRVTLQDC